jgi:hypothetical protein
VIRVRPRSFSLAARLVEAVGATPAGSTVQVPLDGPGDVVVVQQWCEATANTVLAVHPDAVEIYRGHPPDPVRSRPIAVQGIGCGSTRTSTATSPATTAA